MTANSHNNVGAAFNERRRYSDALAEHRKVYRSARACSVRITPTRR